MQAFEPIDPRILGERIGEARKARGLTQEEVASFLEYSRPTYIAMEKGERPAKPDEVIRLAKYFGMKVHELVRTSEPVVDLQPHLRAAIVRIRAGDKEKVNEAVTAFQKLVEDYRDLERMLNAPLNLNYPPPLELSPKYDPARQAESTAIRERQRLGLGDQPIIYLRKILEWDANLRIFYWELPSAVAGMYAYLYTADLGCCILINKNHPAERRRLSMLHEYGHLFVDRFKPGVDYLSTGAKKPANEKFAEAFAINFLMPASSVRQRFQDVVSSTKDFQVSDLARMAHYYFVSFEAMTLRLEDLDLIPKGRWETMQEDGFKPRTAATILELPTQPVDDYAFPECYKYLAVQAYEEEKISEGQLARYLRCSPVEARRIVAECLTSLHVDEMGNEKSIQVNLQQSLLNETA